MLPTSGEWTIAATKGSHKSEDVVVEIPSRTTLELELFEMNEDVSPLSNDRYYIGVASNGNTLVVAGGTQYNKNYSTPFRNSALVEKYDSTLTKSSLTSLSLARPQARGVHSGSYYLFAGGGMDSTNDGNLHESDVVDAYNTSFTRSTPTVLSKPRQSVGGAVVGNYALFAGGEVNTYLGGDVVDRYNRSLVRGTCTSLSGASPSPVGLSFINYALTSDDNGMKICSYNTSLTKTSLSSLSKIPYGEEYSYVGNYAIIPLQSGNVECYNTSLTKSTLDPMNIASTQRYASVKLDDYLLMNGNTSDVGILYAYDSSLTRSSQDLHRRLSRPHGGRVGDYALFIGLDIISGDPATLAFSLN